MIPSPAPTDLRVALIGYGLGGAVFHAPLIASTPGLRLAAIVTADAGRRARALREHPDARVLDATDALWDVAPEVDVVVVASPNATHAPLATRAIGLGLHVVVDKPLAHSASAGRVLAGLARERGVLLVPYQNRRWDGDFLTVRRLIASGALGDVERLESRIDRWRPVPRTGWKGRGGPGLATGILYDIGSHLIDQALVLLGPVREVYAELDRRRSPEVDDDAFVSLVHASGVRAHLHMTVIAAQPAPRFRVLGSRAAYVRHGLDPQEAALAAGARPGDAGWGLDAANPDGTLGAGDDVRPVPTEAGAYERFYAGLVAAIRDGAPPPVELDTVLAGLGIIEAAQRSARERRVVRVDDAGAATD